MRLIHWYRKKIVLKTIDAEFRLYSKWTLFFFWQSELLLSSIPPFKFWKSIQVKSLYSVLLPCAKIKKNKKTGDTRSLGAWRISCLAALKTPFNTSIGCFNNMLPDFQDMQWKVQRSTKGGQQLWITFWSQHIGYYLDDKLQTACPFQYEVPHLLTGRMHKC